MEQRKEIVDGRPRSRYEQEKYVNILVMKGEVDTLKNVLKLIQCKQVGDTSANLYRKQLYDCIIGISMAARAAMEGGMDEEAAYILGDTYIREADQIEQIDELWKLYNRMVLDFAKQVNESRENMITSGAVVQGVDYICHHLHCDIMLKDIADYAGLSETYFSALFKKEMGETVSSFIQRSRIEEAKGMLQYSEDSLVEISRYLGFCSQSHFTKTFRQFTQMTPGEYRKQYFRRTW